MYNLIKKLLKKTLNPVISLEDVLIKSADEKLEIILKKNFNNQTMYLTLDAVNKQFIRKKCGHLLDKKFYFYIINDCIFIEQQ